MIHESAGAQWDVVGVGANSVDYVYRLPAAPATEGQHAKLRIESHSVSCGGQVTTACARPPPWDFGRSISALSGPTTTAFS